MVDTVRTKTDLLTNLFQDGQVNGISANDMRDMIVSLAAPMGGIYFSTPALTSIVSSTVYYKAAGTTNGTNLMGMDMPANNRLRYTGATAKHFHVVAQSSVTLASGTNQNIGIQVYHFDDSAATGNLLSHSEARTTISGTAIQQITTHADVYLSTNDYLEVHVANNTSTNNIQVELGYLFGVGMIM